MNRRRFLQEAATVASAATVAGSIGNAASAPQQEARPASIPPAPVVDRDPPVEAEPLTHERSVADDMVDVIKRLGLEYVTTNPGSSVRGLHESLINYGSNEKPELLTCCHEESSVAMAHGFAKIARPADWRSRARHGRTAARGNGRLQRVLRSRAGADSRGQHAGCDGAAAWGGVGTQRAGRGGIGARLLKVGRPADLDRSLRRIRGARIQAGDDAADGARAARD